MSSDGGLGAVRAYGSGLALLVFMAVAAFVLLDQPSDPGFRPGHRGWVTAHTLAIFEKAEWAHGFVGYTYGTIGEDGDREHFYFDRYPFFFSAGMHGLLELGSDLPAERVDLARQIMNVIFLLTLAAGVAILLELGLSPPLAVAAALLAGSGDILMRYRDMVHFDQPALLGTLVLVWAIVRWHRRGGGISVIVVAAIVACVGRGYACFAVLGVWWLATVVGRRLRMGEILTSVPTLACAAALASASVLLAHNVAMEARTRGVSLEETSIVDSARRRLGFNDQFNEKYRRIVGWPRFLSAQARRAVLGLVPWRLEPGAPLPQTVVWGLLVFLATVVAVFLATREPGMRIPWIVLALSGIAWLLPMRNLAAFHDYTSMFLYGLNLVFWAALLTWIPWRGHLVCLIAAASLFAAAVATRNAEVAALSQSSARETADFTAIAASLPEGAHYLARPGIERLVVGVPYAPGFYLPGRWAVNERTGKRPHPLADQPTYAIGRDPDGDGTSLTPDNEYVFLFRRDGP